MRARSVLNNFPAHATSAASVSVALGLAVKRLKTRGPEKEGERLREVRAADPTGFPQFRRDREKGGED